MPPSAAALREHFLCAAGWQSADSKLSSWIDHWWYLLWAVKQKVSLQMRRDTSSGDHCGTWLWPFSKSTSLTIHCAEDRDITAVHSECEWQITINGFFPHCHTLLRVRCGKLCDNNDWMEQLVRYVNEGAQRGAWRKLQVHVPFLIYESICCKLWLIL